MFTVAVLLPAVRGLKVTLSEQVPPAGIDPGQVPMPKSTALAPINVIPLIVTAMALGFVTVMVTGSDEDPVRVLGKFTVGGEKTKDAGVAPVPVRTDVFGVLAAFEFTDRTPLCGPPPEG